MEFLKRFNELFQRSIPFRQNSGLPTVRSESLPSSRSDFLIKSRPKTLEERYRIVEDERTVESIFKRVAAPLLGICDSLSTEARNHGGRRAVLRELGTTEDRRSYLFMKTMNEYGWLMERNGAGWRISRAEKIVGQSLFMRSHQDPWDLVTIWNDPQGECLTRVRSMRFGQELMTLSEYERRLGESFRDILSAGSEN